LSKENKNIEVLQRFLDYIVDGRYIHELRDLTLHFKGSSNQRVIDVKKTLNNNQVTTIEW
jgi:anaerobic ribonucleoside-triphosphate reductase activating protein